MSKKPRSPAGGKSFLHVPADPTTGQVREPLWPGHSAKKGSTWNQKEQACNGPAAAYELWDLGQLVAIAPC